MSTLNFNRQEFLRSYPDTKDWMEADTSLLAGKDQKSFELRKLAVDLAYEGHSLAEITRITKIRYETIISTLLKCVSINPTTQKAYGYGGCIPGLRVNKYTRRVADKPGGGKAGLLGKFFLEHPEIKEKVDAYHLKKVNALMHKGIEPSAELLIPGALSRVGKTYSHFLRLCEKARISPTSYPYTSQDSGYEAVRRYLVKLVKEHLEDAMKPVHGQEAAEKMKRTGGERSSWKPIYPYQQVAIDEQTFDVDVPLVVPDLYGGEIIIGGARIQVCTVVEIMTTLVLGYAISYNPHSVSTGTVMRAIYRAIKPWTPHTFTIPNLSYKEGDGFPSGMIPALSWATWGETLLDNALAHKANEIQRILKDVIGSSVQMGPIGAPEVREGVERVFGGMTRGFWPEFPGATGSSPQDPRYNNPLNEALSTSRKLKFTDVEQALEVWFARHNNTPTARLGYKSPLQFLKEQDELGNLEGVTRFDADRQVRLYKLGERIVKRVAGNPAEGRPIYVEYLHARYSSRQISYLASLLGKNLILYIHPEDARFALAFTENGTELGILQVKGQWAEYRHTLEIRRLYSTLKARNHPVVGKYENPVHVVVAYLMDMGTRSKAHALHYQEIKDITGVDGSDLSPSQANAEFVRPRRTSRPGNSHIPSPQLVIQPTPSGQMVNPNSKHLEQNSWPEPSSIPLESDDVPLKPRLI